MSHSISSWWNSLPDVGARGSPLELSAVPQWDKVQIKAARYAETQHLKALFHLPVLWLLFTAIHFNHPVLSPSKDWVVPGIPPGFLLQQDSTHIQSQLPSESWNEPATETQFSDEHLSHLKPYLVHVLLHRPLRPCLHPEVELSQAMALYGRSLFSPVRGWLPFWGCSGLQTMELSGTNVTWKFLSFSSPFNHI